ncbi:MAG: glycosyltransferase [Desulfobacterales bacterium]|nr:glycosyltransferase [Desulfobacterales bacterium]
MKITHISHSDLSGGAARAAFRLHRALQMSGHSSRMLVQKKVSDDLLVSGPKNYLEKFISLAEIFLGEQYTRLQHTENTAPHTPSCGFPFGAHSFLKEISQSDVAHLHWFRETPTLATIGRITEPVIWTLHDMWAFCGAEHYTSDNDSARWRNGYTKNNRSGNDKGFDIDRWTWCRKKKHWQHPLHIITPSNWLAECASQSALMHSWPIHVIPNALNIDVFKPLNKSYARNVFNLPQDTNLILFGALKGGNDPRKGFSLLLSSLKKLFPSKSQKHICVIFGESKPENPPNINVPLHWTGPLTDEHSLALLYNAADVMVVPSRQENLPQTGTEAQACGCPVVAFNTTGLPDVVAHKESGYLAHPFDPNDLAHGIQWVLNDKERYNKLSDTARTRAVTLWAPSVVVPQYIDIYQQAIEQQKRISN